MEVHSALNASLGNNRNSRLFSLRLLHGGKPITILHEAGAPLQHQGEWSTIQLALFR